MQAKRQQVSPGTDDSGEGNGFQSGFQTETEAPAETRRDALTWHAGPRPFFRSQRWGSSFTKLMLPHGHGEQGGPSPRLGHS